MINLDYKYVESNSRPSDIDYESSPTTVFIRKNIREINFIDDTGKTIVLYAYEEASMSKNDYIKYMAEKNKADIEYIYMMEGLDYYE